MGYPRFYPFVLSQTRILDHHAVQVWITIFPGPGQCIGIECIAWPCIDEENIDDDYEELCRNCPEKETCVIELEEMEDDCPYLQACSEMPSKEEAENES